MKSDQCPGCGAVYNGRKCRSCGYEPFTEEIAHGNHSHKGEPLVIDAPARRPIPRKDPFSCEKSRKPRSKTKHPLLRFFMLLYVIYALMPLLRNWGLELKQREAAAEPVPAQLVTLSEKEDITISVQTDQLSSPHWEKGLRIWVGNKTPEDLTFWAQYVTVNGFVMPNASLHVEARGHSDGMGTLYLSREDLTDAGIEQVQELTFVLQGMDKDYRDVFVSQPITLNTGAEPESYTRFDAPVLLEEDGLVLKRLGYRPHKDYPKFENGHLLFYVENNTDTFLSMNSMETTLGETPVDLFLWAGLPPRSRGVVRLELAGLEGLDFTAPSELEDLHMIVEFWNPEDGSSREYPLTVPMTSREPVVIS